MSQANNSLIHCFIIVFQLSKTNHCIIEKLLDVCSKLESSEESGQQHQNEILHFKEKLSSITKDLQQENSLVLKEKLAVEQLVVVWKK